MSKRNSHVFIEGIESKTCSKCEEIKPIIEYAKNKNKWDGICSQCKMCQKKYYNENSDKVKERISKYIKENPEKKKQQDKKSYQKRKEKIYEYKKEYYKNNKEKIKEYHREYKRERRKIDPNFKLRNDISRRILIAIKENNACKEYNTIELIGCTIENLREYLENQFKEGMNWENHCYRGWHVDHIIPCSKFDLTDPEQQKECFHYTNLQPLWGWENMKKGNRT